MISKELAEEVLEVKINKVKISDNMHIVYLQIDSDNFIDGVDQGATMEFEEDTEPKRYQFMNGYELSHKCKEWARDKCNEITIYRTCFDTPYRVAVNEFWDCDNNGSVPYSTSEYENYADTEVEAVINACEYILKESK